MTTSLSALRNAPPPPRPERLVAVSLRTDLVKRINELSAELAALPQPDPEAEVPRKMASAEAKPPEHPRAASLREEIQTLLAEMAEHEGELTVRATRTDGEWRNWADAHPARGRGDAGYERDQRYGNVVNVDALCDDLGRYCVAWNGEDLLDGDWASIFEPALDGTGQRYTIAEAVLVMYEGRQDFRQWRSALSTTLQRWSDSVSPEASESARSDSTAGSPAPSSEASTPTAVRSA